MQANWSALDSDPRRLLQLAGEQGGARAANPPRPRNSLLRGLANWGGGRLISAAMLLLASWAIWTVHRAPAWHVHWVEVVGCTLISPEQVVGAAGLADAWSVELEPVTVAERVRTVPGVRTAQAEVWLPNHVRITVSEERPVAVLQEADGQLWVTERGQLLRPFGKVDHLPVLALPSGNWPGESMPAEVINGLSAMAAAFPGQSEFQYDPMKGFMIKDNRGYPVYLGNASELARQLAVAAALDKQLRAKGQVPQFVDLRTVAGAYYR